MAQRGRPTDYNKEVADKIIEAIRSTSKGIARICEEDGMPDRSTFYRWMDVYEELRDQYARAKEDQADLFVDQIIEIADNSAHDTIETDFGVKENTEWVNRSKLRIDARKWAASKLKPKKYGDKLDLTSDGDKLPNCVPNVIVYNSAPPLSANEDEVS